MDLKKVVKIIILVLFKLYFTLNLNQTLWLKLINHKKLTKGKHRQCYPQFGVQLHRHELFYFNLNQSGIDGIVETKG